MKTLIQQTIFLLCSYAASHTMACAEDVIRFSAVLATNGVPQDIIPYPMNGLGVFALVGQRFDFDVSVDDGGSWVAAIDGPRIGDSNGLILFELFGKQCFTPLPPIHHGGCDWRGTALLSESQIADLVRGRLYVSMTKFFFPPGFAVEGRIFLDNNQNFIPDTEEDTDGDGVSDAEDMCPNTPAGVPVNRRGCTVADLCPCDAGWKNHGQYVSCVDGALVDFVKRGSLTSQQAREIISQSARSDCGKKGGAAK